MKTWFTSDTHFGHTSTWQKFKKPGSDTEPLRPFHSTEEMDCTLIDNWNAVVGVDDLVYHLGDFAMGRTAVPNILQRLNGKVILVHGNHDSPQVRGLSHWQLSTPYLEVTIDKQFIVLCHYKFDVFNRCHRGGIQLFGHSHGSNSDNSQQCDVGVDCWNYTPVSLQDIKRRMAKSPPFRSKDHHVGHQKTA